MIPNLKISCYTIVLFEFVAILSSIFVMVMSWFKGGFFLIVMYPWIGVIEGEARYVDVRVSSKGMMMVAAAAGWWCSVPLSSDRVMLHLVPLCLGHVSVNPLMFFLGDMRFW